MSDLDAYFALASARPELFRNPPGAGFEILLSVEEISQAERRSAGRPGNTGSPAERAAVGIVFRDQYLLLLRDAVRFTDGSLGTYLRIVAPEDSCPGVVVLPVWHGKVLLIRHFRHATRTWHLEIPRGFGIDPDTREDARRELYEEIGAADIELTELGWAHPDTGLSASAVALFYARVGSYGEPDRKEAITDIVPTSVPDLERMIRDGELTDGYLLSAYAMAKAKNLI